MLLNEYKSFFKKSLNEAPKDRDGNDGEILEPKVKLKDKTTTKPMDFKDPTSLGSISNINNKPADLIDPSTLGKTLSKSEIKDKLASKDMAAGASKVMTNFLDKTKGITDPLGTPASAGATSEPEKPVTPKDLPAIISKAVAKTGRKDIKRNVDVDWMQVKDLPGYAVEQIRGAFRPLFQYLTDSKLEDVNVTTDFMGMSPSVDVRQLIGYIATFGIKDESFSLEAFDIDPNEYHITNAHIYNWDGVSYLVMKEKLMGKDSYYVYAAKGRGTKLNGAKDSAQIK